MSICIPSYNRPELLRRLLESVDAGPDSIEVVIVEDHAPRRQEVRDYVTQFRAESAFRVKYAENTENLGYDRNLRELVALAEGKFIVFMGDDDQFIAGHLDRFLEFLRKNEQAGYVLRSYAVIHDGGTQEVFKYYPESRLFAPGLETYVALFRKSVSLAGFTFKRELASNFLVDDFDGTLLFQLYLAAEIALNYPTAYCDIPFVFCEQTFRSDNAFFGSSKSERDSFVPGKVLPTNSINFMRGFFRISEFLDRKYHFQSTDKVRRDISKYSYPVLAIQRKRGVATFLQYAWQLRKEFGLGSTLYFYLYTFGLLVGGEKHCDRLIVRIKRILGSTPRL